MTISVSGGGGGATDLSGYVPYTGATGNLDLGTHDFTTTGTITGVIKYTITIPVVNPTGADNFLVYRFPRVATITAVNAISRGGTSVTCKVNECDGDGNNAAQITNSIVAAVTNTVGTITNAAVDAGDYLSYTSSAIVGTVTQLLITVDFTM